MMLLAQAGAIGVATLVAVLGQLAGGVGYIVRLERRLTHMETEARMARTEVADLRRRLGG